jgi:hypothetical protein
MEKLVQVPAGPMTEDGRDWGERCVDMYKIIDKVRHLPAAYGIDPLFKIRTSIGTRKIFFKLTVINMTM